MVSKYQENRYRPLGVPCAVVEYPIENKIRTKTREEALQELGLDPNLKHVINVGLFTPRKNQAEVIEYAKMLKDYPIQFHFLGNQAENFEYYWGPLMKHFPSNCKWWNERDDVDKFYEAADLFLFTSRGHNTDHETMPLVIREALSWKTPSLIYNLPVYLNYFNKYPTINYLNDNIEENAGKILDVLNIPNTRSFKMDYGFSVEWNLEEQKVYYSCQKQVDFPVIVSIKEYKSDAVLWASNLDSIVAGVSYWMLPISKHHHSYEHDPHFTGIKFCIYRKDTEEQIFEQPFFHKFVNVPTVSLSNFIP
jgi:glycosyltransferase involved in cell wall biosynthesis